MELDACIQKLISSVRANEPILSSDAASVVSAFRELPMERRLPTVVGLLEQLVPLGAFHGSSFKRESEGGEVRQESSPNATTTDLTTQATDTAVTDSGGICVTEEEPDSSQSAFWRRIEERFGFSQELVERVLLPLGFDRHAPDTLRLASFFGMLPSGMLPAARRADARKIDFELHRLVQACLTELRPVVRDHKLVLLIGDGLSELFPDEDVEEPGSFRFWQYCYLADNYLIENPDDPVALAWRGELACWEGDERTARNCQAELKNIASQVSKNSVGTIALAIAALDNWVHGEWQILDAAHEVLGLPSDPRRDDYPWRHPNEPALGYHFSEMKSNWWDREEAMLDGLIRCAIENGTWDMSLLIACDMGGVFLDLAYERLPAVAWVWLASQERYDDHDCVYYDLWQKAFLSSGDAGGTPTVSYLSSVVLLVGQLLEVFEYPDVKIPLIMDRLVRLSHLPEWKERAAKTIGLANKLAREWSKVRIGHRIAIAEAFDRLPFKPDLSKIFAKTVDFDTTSLRENKLASQIAQGETPRLEFKSTLRVNLHTQQNDEKIELACLKTIAGFLNSRQSGQLVVGVSDKNEVLGLSADLAFLKNEDKMHLHLANLIRDKLGIEHSANIRSKFATVDNQRVLVVNCRPSSVAVFLKNRDSEEFYVRMQTSTVKLTHSKCVMYCKQRFG